MRQTETLLISTRPCSQFIFIGLAVFASLSTAFCRRSDKGIRMMFGKMRSGCFLSKDITGIRIFGGIQKKLKESDRVGQNPRG